ncbi:AAA family ATPase [Chryseobacterium arthrosphaerae]|uniref:AAA family ATPase n=1 Tax=Chryseobacterium arthrosphaerae TaxID=651561 RepID=UPI00241EBA04|nr:AAA family ATPase [Chryseobacterium arthrosphaerae]
MNYHELQVKAFDWLKHQYDRNPSFTFSVRQKASKGAEQNYFIGTERSRYFSTTFWNIPVSYPGSSTDLINLVFALKKNNKLSLYIQFYQTKKPNNDQNKYALELIRNIKPKLKKLDPLIYVEGREALKMEYFAVYLPELYDSFESSVDSLNMMLEKVISIVDEEIFAMKNSYPAFKANRFLPEEQEKMISKMYERFNRYSSDENDNTDDEENWKILEDFDSWFVNNFDQPTGIFHGMIFGFLYQVSHFKGLIPESKLNDYDYETIEIIKKEIPNFDYEGLDYFEKFLDYTVKNLNTLHAIMKQPLNQILYGPPGTGKTYNTINKAIQIANPSFDLSDHTRKEIREEYKKLVDEGRIVFTTFHQSMSYEDFIEGIKPKIDEDENGNKKVIYDIEDGIFKRIADKARKPRLKAGTTAKRYTFGDAWSDLIVDANKHLEDEDPLVLTIQTPDLGLKIVDISDKGNLSLKPIYSEDSKIYTVSYSRAEKLQQAFPDLSVIKNVNKEFREVIGGSNSTAYWSVLNYINNKIKEKSITEVKEETLPPLPHVLIIDEVNRGNVSQIFGELITLIEEDKRLGNDESLEITLPYSKEKFGVPPNLYIIGTMNTADRSVEALDTALRRRFSFEEMPPKPDLLLSPSEMIEKLLWDYKEYPWEDEEYEPKERELFDLLNVPPKLRSDRKSIWKTMNADKDSGNIKHGTYFSEFFTDIDCKNLLITINKRIEKLIDKDHAIGHAYFMGKNDKTIVDSFYKNIIPLLQEYFFGDYGKIGLVLGKGFIRKKEYNASVFADFDYENDYSERESYEIIDYRKPDLNYELTLEEGKVKMTFERAVQLLMN